MCRVAPAYQVLLTVSLPRLLFLFAVAVCPFFVVVAVLLNLHLRQSAIFPETMCKAGWSKEHTTDALLRKAGYWKPRGDRSGVPGAWAPDSASMGTPNTTTAVAATTINSSSAITDPAVSGSAVFLRFQTVTHRMNFSKYQRASRQRN